MFILLSAIFVGFFSVGYKILGIKRYNSNMFLCIYSMFFSLAAFFGAVVLHESISNSLSLVFGMINGLFMYFAVLLYTQVVKYVRLNISWSVLQFSLIVPVLVSIFVYKEEAGIHVYIGILLILLAIYAFGRGKGTGKELGKEKSTGSNPAVPDVKLGIMLLLSTLFSGATNAVPQVYVSYAESGGNFPLLFYTGITIFMLSLLHLLIKRNKEYKEISFGLITLSVYMGFVQMLAIFFLLLALRIFPGVVVFPLRNVTALLVIYAVSYLFFKERLNRVEGLGVVFTVFAIVLISMAL